MKHIKYLLAGLSVAVVAVVLLVAGVMAFHYAEWLQWAALGALTVFVLYGVGRAILEKGNKDDVGNK